MAVSRSMDIHGIETPIVVWAGNCQASTNICSVRPAQIYALLACSFMVYSLDIHDCIQF